MNSSGLWQDIKSNPLILIAVVGFHLAVIVLLSINLISSEVPDNPAPSKQTIKAVVVDAAKIEAEVKKLKQAEAKKKQQALAQQKKIKKEADKARKKLEAEKKRLVALKKKQSAEKKRVEAEKKKVAAEKQKKAAEKKRQTELEEQRRQEAAAELKRRIEEEERREAEALQQAEHNKKLNSLRAQYVKLIEQKVARNWIRPVTSTADMSCEVGVIQSPMGDVRSVSLQQCANDLAFQRSIERAVRRASPLPPPPNPEVFDREIRFTFKPES